MDFVKLFNDTLADAYWNEVPMEPNCAVPADRLARLNRNEKFVFDYSQRLIEAYHQALVQDFQKSGIPLDS